MERREKISSVARLLTLFMLLELIACKGPEFSAYALEKGHFTSLTTFNIEKKGDPLLFIWNMHPIPFEELKPLVSSQLQKKGYRLVSQQGADFRVILTSFTEDSNPQSRIVIVEMFDRSTTRKLWSGRAEIPYLIDSKVGIMDQPTLLGLLDLIPRRIGSDHTISMHQFTD